MIYYQLKAFVANLRSLQIENGINMKLLGCVLFLLCLGLNAVFFVPNAIITPDSLNKSQSRSLRINNFFSPFEWDISSPEEQGLSSTILMDVFQEAEQMSFLYSLLVLRQGSLVVEHYFNGAGKNVATHIHSASKSFTSALIGIAFRENIFHSLDQKLLDFFPEYDTPDLDPRKQNITIGHLLTMRAGFNFNDSTSDWEQVMNSPNYVQYFINLPLIYDPGERWHYSTPQTDLLAAILAKASNMTAREFAEQYLFQPLQISIGDWHQDPQGYYTGGRAMFFVPRNMARLGQLYLNNGSIDGEQIIPASWIEESLQDYSDGGIYPRYGEGLGYGYQWWLETIEGYKTFYAWGHGGQYVINIPALDMIIVTTASGTIYGLYPNQLGLIRGLVYQILTAVLDPLNNQGQMTFDLLAPGMFIAMGLGVIVILIMKVKKK